MNFRKFRSGHLLLNLNYINGEYFIENTIPVTISQDILFGDRRIINLISSNSGRIYPFKVCNFNYFRPLTSPKGFKGIILSK